MNKKPLTGDSVIAIGKSISLSQYIAYFQQATGEDLPGAEFQLWLKEVVGKTLDDALEAYRHAAKRKTMREIMTESRFDLISEQDKAFIVAFDDGIERLGYDFGGGIGEGYCWCKYMIIYAKTGQKSKKVAARIYIRDGGIVLRLFLNDVDKHIGFIEKAPPHIRDVFAGADGDCSCNPPKEGCRMRKTYTLDGRQIEKCSGVVFEFHQPSMDKLDDYMDLLRAFYPMKKRGREAV